MILTTPQKQKQRIALMLKCLSGEDNMMNLNDIRAIMQDYYERPEEIYSNNSEDYTTKTKIRSNLQLLLWGLWTTIEYLEKEIEGYKSRQLKYLETSNKTNSNYQNLKRLYYTSLTKAQTKDADCKILKTALHNLAKDYKQLSFEKKNALQIVSEYTEHAKRQYDKRKSESVQE